MQGQRRLVIKTSRDLTQVLYLIEGGEEKPLTPVPANFKPETEVELKEVLKGFDIENLFLRVSFKGKEVVRVGDLLG